MSQKKPRTKVLSRLENALIKDCPRGTKKPIFISLEDAAKAIVESSRGNLKEFKEAGLISFVQCVFRGQRSVSPRLRVHLLAAVEQRLGKKNTAAEEIERIVQKIDSLIGLVNLYRRQRQVDPDKMEFVTSAELAKLAKITQPAGGCYLIELLDRIKLIRRNIGQPKKET